MDRSESWRRRQQHDVTGVDHFLIGVQSNELERIFDSNLPFDFVVGLEIGQAALDCVFVDIGNGHKVACHMTVDQRLRIWTNEIQPKL